MTTTPKRIGHSGRCEQAEKPPCACECGGAEHGWQGALAIAADSSDDALRKLEREADQAWDTAVRKSRHSRSGRVKPGQQTMEGQRAATKRFVTETIRWLRRDRNLQEATKQLGEPFRISRDIDPDDPHRHATPEEETRFVETHVIPQLRREFGDRRIDAFQAHAVKAHFWCELLAQTAHALKELQGMNNRAKKAVVAILTSDDKQRPENWAALLPEGVVIERAVELVFKHLPRAATGGFAVGDVLRLIWPARVLAVLMCREPRRHPAVREHCVKPIVQFGTAEIRKQVKDRLQQAFPHDWPAPPAGT
jgi:hypothetical protein